MKIKFCYCLLILLLHSCDTKNEHERIQSEEINRRKSDFAGYWHVVEYETCMGKIKADSADTITYIFKDSVYQCFLRDSLLFGGRYDIYPDTALSDSFDVFRIVLKGQPNISYKQNKLTGIDSFFHGNYYRSINRLYLVKQGVFTRLEKKK